MGLLGTIFKPDGTDMPAFFVPLVFFDYTCHLALQFFQKEICLNSSPAAIFLRRCANMCFECTAEIVTVAKAAAESRILNGKIRFL